MIQTLGQYAAVGKMIIWTCRRMDLMGKHCCLPCHVFYNRGPLFQSCQNGTLHKHNVSYVFISVTQLKPCETSDLEFLYAL